MYLRPGILYLVQHAVDQQILVRGQFSIEVVLLGDHSDQLLDRQRILSHIVFTDEALSLVRL